MFPLSVGSLKRGGFNEKDLMDQQISGNAGREGLVLDKEENVVRNKKMQAQQFRQQNSNV